MDTSNLKPKVSHLLLHKITLYLYLLNFALQIHTTQSVKTISPSFMLT